jgi:hypothetical protein
MPRQKVIIGLRVNYGMQAFYREHGIEPRCGICRHFDGELVDVSRDERICAKTARACRPGDVCYSPEREPGADDADP